jgi:hypothetical protein
VEVPSGDVAMILRVAGGVLVAVVDGAGHGPLAREVADRALVEVVDRPLAEIVVRMNDALQGSRGAAVTLARIGGGVVTLYGVGNVAACVISPDRVHRYLPSAGMLGRRHRAAAVERMFPVDPQGCVLLATDGVSSDIDTRQVAGRSAIHIAQHVLRNHAKAHDDALVFVAR